MSKSKKSNSKNSSDVKTKAELQKAFEKTYDLLKEEEKKVVRCRKQLEDAQEKLTTGDDVLEQLELKTKELSEITIQLKEVSEQKYELEKKVEKLTLLNEALLKEKETLQRTEQEAKIESLRAELRQSEEETEALVQQLEEARKSVAQTSEIERLEKDPRQSKEDRTELIHSNKELEKAVVDLKGKLVEKEKITTSDIESPSGEAALFENEKEETGPLAKEESSEQTAVISAAPASTNVLQDIQFLQSKRSVKVGIPLRANHPFSVLTRLHFPISPTSENIDIDTSTYDIRIIALDNNETRVVARSGLAEKLSAGVRDYSNEIKMPGLKPGNYFLRISTLALFADIKENKKFDLVVKG